MKPKPGLWAIEPHLSRDGVGAKWEEIRVVTDNDAYWFAMPYRTNGHESTTPCHWGHLNRGPSGLVDNRGPS